MTRYYITHQTLSYNCGLIQVDMKSSTAQHLWLLYTVHEPSIDPQPDVQQPRTKPHQNNYHTYIDGVIEQEEPGDTNQHTFHFALPPATGIIWFYTVNLGHPGLKATRSPIFAYEFIPTPIYYEDFQPPAVYDHGWQLSAFPPYSQAIPSLNRMYLLKSNLGIGSVQISTARLGNGFFEVIGPFNDCPVLFTFTLPDDDTAAPFSKNNIFLRLTPYQRPGVGISLFIVPSPNNGAIIDAPPPVNRMVIALPAGERTISLHAIIAARHAAFPASMTPGQTSINQISLNSGGHANTPLYAHAGNFGPLRLASVTDTPIDVSRFWRSKRLSPVLR